MDSRVTLREAAQQALELCDRINDEREIWGQHELRAVCERLRAALAEPQAIQVRPSDFAELIKGKETMTGVPVYWAEWPNKEDNFGLPSA